MKQSVTNEDIKRFLASFDGDPKNLLALNAVTENGIAAVALSRKEVDRINYTFSNLIDSPEATNQERSGRCWLFSGLSLLCLEAMKKLNLQTFELSEVYQMFWDKLEKANYFLENIIETRDEPLDSRMILALLSDPLSDGGQWDMFVNLVDKYGVVPKSFMPETISSSNSDSMNTLLAFKAERIREVASRYVCSGFFCRGVAKVKVSNCLRSSIECLQFTWGSLRATFTGSGETKKRYSTGMVI